MTKPASLARKRKKFMTLAQRYIQVSLLLPRIEDFDPATADVPQLKMILAELDKIKAELLRGFRE